jgi:hypothetical protein
VKLADLSQTYTGSPVQAAASSNPSGLEIALTYNGKPIPPTAAGSYSVVGTVSDPDYQGSATGTLVAAKATPIITWATPAAIPAGTVLSSKQLDATTGMSGKLAYSPAAGTKPARGTVKLTATFTPTDTANWKTTTATMELVVK